MILRKRIKPKNWYQAAVHFRRLPGMAYRLDRRPGFLAIPYLLKHRKPHARGPFAIWKMRNWYRRKR